MSQLEPSHVPAGNPTWIVQACVASGETPFDAVIVIVGLVPTSPADGVPESVLPESVSQAGFPLTENVGAGLPVATSV